MYQFEPASTWVREHNGFQANIFRTCPEALGTGKSTSVGIRKMYHKDCIIDFQFLIEKMLSVVH